jgi:hypothetical protein
MALLATAHNSKGRVFKAEQFDPFHTARKSAKPKAVPWAEIKEAFADKKGATG